MSKRVHCDNCESDGHPTFMCPRPAKKSTAARSERAEAVGELQIADSPNGAPMDERLKRRKAKQQVEGKDDQTSQALPVDTNPVQDAEPELKKTMAEQDVQIIRPGSKFNKTDYQREYVAKWRRGEVGNKHRSKAKEDKQNG